MFIIIEKLFLKGESLLKSTMNINARPRYVGAGVGRQEVDELSDLYWPTKPLESSSVLVKDAFVFGDPFHMSGRFDEVWADGIATDSVQAELLGDALGESTDGRFRRRVESQAYGSVASHA